MGISLSIHYTYAIRGFLQIPPHSGHLEQGNKVCWLLARSRPASIPHSPLPLPLPLGPSLQS